MSAHAASPTLFLCHGAGGDASSCAALADAIQAERGVPCVPLSYPGRAGVPGPARESVGELAAFVREEVAQRLGSVDAPHVMLGHSMGGAVAIEYALAAPVGLVALVLLSTGARLRVHPSILAALSPDASSSVGADVSAGASAFAREVEAAARTPRQSALADWRAADAFDRMARVHELTTPTLVLVGDTDLLTPLKYARYLSERIAGAQLVVLSGCGHSLPTEQSALVARHVAEFLRRVSGGGG